MEEVLTRRLETWPSLSSSSPPPLGRLGIGFTSLLAADSLLTVWLQREREVEAEGSSELQPEKNDLGHLLVGSGSFMKVL